MEKYIQVITTTAKKEDAAKIAAALVEKRLAACVQIVGPLYSTYRWQGKIEQAEEWQCLIKSRHDLFGKLEQAIKAIHPYEIPEIIALTITDGSAEYLQWLHDELQVSLDFISKLAGLSRLTGLGEYSMLLAGDIGATKTHLGIFDPGGTNNDQLPQPLTARTFENARYQDLETIVREFIAQVQVGKVEQACFGVAGPVLEGPVAITNLPWQIDAKQLASALDIPSVDVINDLLATASALPLLPPQDLHTLNEGHSSPRHGNMAVIAAGTGLGEAFLIWDGRQYQGYASEGGHGDFAPQNGLEIELLSHLRQRWGHVSYDRICTGRGLPEIYRFLKERNQTEDTPGLAERLATAADPTPLIIQVALAEEGKSLICTQALEIFVSTLGAEAGNMALKFLATGGIYVAGGLPPRILPILNKPAFMEAFRRKGRLSAMMAQIPVHVVLNPAAPLLGAAIYARKT